MMLALHGFDAYGLEISADAVATAKAYAASEMAAPSRHNFSKAGSDNLVSYGEVKFLQGDFFRRDWETTAPLDDGTKFDMIYDYTVIFPSNSRLMSLTVLVSLCTSTRDSKRLGHADGGLTQTRRFTRLSRVSALQRTQASWATMGR